jgi:hypothetical protein
MEGKVSVVHDFFQDKGIQRWDNSQAILITNSIHLPRELFQISRVVLGMYSEQAGERKQASI